jgi:Fe-S-cluster containining protein
MSDTPTPKSDGAPAVEGATPRAVSPEDIERGLRFNHMMESQTKERVSDVATTLYAVIEALVAQGVLSIEEYNKRREACAKRESERSRAQEYLPVMSGTVDKYALKDLPQIDCDARLPLCRARCCTLTFPLSYQDLEERVVRWDYGRPYQIGRREDGYCVHNSPETRGCTVYQNRPAICRTYDCSKDKRIWADFEKRIPAQ